VLSFVAPPGIPAGKPRLPPEALAVLVGPVLDEDLQAIDLEALVLQRAPQVVQAGLEQLLDLLVVGQHDHLDAVVLDDDVEVEGAEPGRLEVQDHAPRAVAQDLGRALEDLAHHGLRPCGGEAPRRPALNGRGPLRLAGRRITALEAAHPQDGRLLRRARVRRFVRVAPGEAAGFDLHLLGGRGGRVRLAFRRCRFGNGKGLPGPRRPCGLRLRRPLCPLGAREDPEDLPLPGGHRLHGVDPLAPVQGLAVDVPRLPGRLPLRGDAAVVLDHLFQQGCLGRGEGAFPRRRGGLRIIGPFPDRRLRRGRLHGLSGQIPRMLQGLRRLHRDGGLRNPSARGGKPPVYAGKRFDPLSWPCLLPLRGCCLLFALLPAGRHIQSLGPEDFGKGRGEACCRGVPGVDPVVPLPAGRRVRAAGDLCRGGGVNRELNSGRIHGHSSSRFARAGEQPVCHTAGARGTGRRAKGLHDGPRVHKAPKSQPFASHRARPPFHACRDSALAEGGTTPCGPGNICLPGPVGRAIFTARGASRSTPHLPMNPVRRKAQRGFGAR